MSEPRDRATIAEDMRELCRGKMWPSDRRLLTTAADLIDVDGELAAVLTAEIARLRKSVAELETRIEWLKKCHANSHPNKTGRMLE